MKKINLIALTLLSINLSAFEAGHCPVGPFGTDGDTGAYHGRCHELSRLEICSYYLDGVELGEINDVDPAKVQFCKNILE